MNAADHMVRYRLREPDTHQYFLRQMQPAEGEQFDIAVDDADMAFMKRLLPDQPTAYRESKYLCEKTAVYLLRFDACLFHSAAFVWRGFAWLLAGPSGFGKTTQMVWWKQLFGEEVQVISGDMPILTTQSDGTIRVWPSPWNGKERWAGSISAPLGGVIFLEQKKENSISLIGPEESVWRCFQQYGCMPETEDEIHRLAALVDRTVSVYPIWLLQNRGDKEAALLTAHTILKHLSGEEKEHGEI